MYGAKLTNRRSYATDARQCLDPSAHWATKTNRCGANKHVRAGNRGQSRTLAGCGPIDTQLKQCKPTTDWRLPLTPTVIRIRPPKLQRFPSRDSRFQAPQLILRCRRQDLTPTTVTTRRTLSSDQTLNKHKLTLNQAVQHQS